MALLCDARVSSNPTTNDSSSRHSKRVAVRYKETVEGCPENVEVLFKLGDGFDLINDGSEPSLVCQNLKGCGMLVSKELQPLLESASNELVQSAARLNSRLEQRVPTARSK